MRTATRPRFYRFSEWSRETLNRELQTHTRWTDGQASVAEVCARAAERGIAELAFTEHARAASTYCPEFLAEVDAAREAHPELAIYGGFEVKVIDTAQGLDITPEIAGMADIVLGSVHSFPLPDGGRAHASAFGREEAQAIELALARTVLESGQADVLAHPGGMCLRHFAAFPESSFEALIALAVERGVAFELNASYHGPVIEMLLPLLEKHDPLTSIGSDAHVLDQIGACRDLLLELTGL